MSMDDSWRTLFDDNAKSDLPDHLASCWTQEGYEERLLLFPQLLQQLLTSEYNNALDVGCGPGAYCQLLRERGLAVTGVDYSELMLVRARRNSPTAVFKQANAYHLPFEDRSFDLVISIGVLQCLEDVERVVRELCRVARRSIVCSTLRSTLRTPKKDFRAQLIVSRVSASETERRTQLTMDSVPTTDSSQRSEPFAQLSTPTRSYHPEYIKGLFEQEGYAVDLVFDNNGALLSDCFFVLARRTP